MEARRAAPGAQASVDDLSPDNLQQIVALLTAVNPCWDRHDVLKTACSLACVGNETCTGLAKELFTFLSPRLGQDPPNDVTEGSPASALKAVLKQWGLPCTGNKAALWQRLLDQVQDSEEGPEGEPPRSCIVSGATRKELEGFSRQRCSRSRAKDVFQLYSFEMSGYESEEVPGHKGKPMVVYRLSDVKACALKKHGSWEAIQAKKQASAESWKQTISEIDAKRETRKAELRAELLRRGHSLDEVDEEFFTNRNPALSAVLYFSKEKEPVGPAVDHLERFQFLLSSSREHHTALAYMTDTMERPKSLAKYRFREQKLERAAAAGLRSWLASRLSLDEAKATPGLPPHMLPELERAWAQRGAGAGPSNGLAELWWLQALAEAEHEEGDEY